MRRQTRTLGITIPFVAIFMLACGAAPRTTTQPTADRAQQTKSRVHTPPPASTAKQTFQIYVIDVGQGDSTLVVGPKQQDGHQVTLLMDAGDGGYFGKPRGDKLVRAVLDKLNMTSLDYVVMSHFDSDHIGGLVGGTQKRSLIWTTKKQSGAYTNCRATNLFPKKALIDMGPPVAHTKKSLRREWEACAPMLTKEHNVKHVRVTGPKQIGTRLRLGKGVTAQIVAGRGWVIGADNRVPLADSPNESSVALLITNTQGFSFLVTGDLIGQAHGSEDAELERALAKGLGATEASCYGLDVLRTGHHGAANATEKTFVKLMCPTVAIISAGDGNKYHHPNCRTLNTLHAGKVPVILQTETGTTDCPVAAGVRRTVVDGTIRITVTGKRYSIDGFGSESGLTGKRTKKLGISCRGARCEAQ